MSLRGSLFSRRLEYFAAVYEKRTYMGAARAIPISYQGLRKALRQLEEGVGAPLFEEDERKVLLPTPASDELYAVYHRWAIDAVALERTVENIVQKGRRLYRLVVSNGSISALGTDLPEVFKATHPALELDIDEHFDERVDQLLASGECALAITAAPFNPAFVTVPLLHSDICVWVNRSHPLANRDVVAYADLDGQDIMPPNWQFKEAGRIADEMEAAGVEPHSITYSNDMLTSFHFALSGQGIGFGVMQAAAMLESIDEVRAIPLVDSPYDIGVSRRSDYVLSDEDRDVLSFLVDFAVKGRA